MTIVVFEVRAPTAFWSCATVETLTTFPEGGGRGGAGGGTVKALRAWLPIKANATARGDAGRKQPRRRPAGLFSPHGAGSFRMKAQVYTPTPAGEIAQSCPAVSARAIRMAARDRRRFRLAEAVRVVGRGAKDAAGLLRLAECLERQTELKEREGMTFG